ncbi:ImmA/IrrE family metallo-endopeptidase [Paraburkholderia hospita]|uniref:ImmA/IrrE family metallo-endopeptidase n=1 Tax=Paraburkholderia hospita TaxID=169430 RepID=UPI00142322C0|nr:ImmA/IrrE family metallo-endopeptidase [Paraburkholderia hospita]
MSKTTKNDIGQSQLFGEHDDIDPARSLLDQLLTDSSLYRTGTEYRNLLDFVVRLRNFAPFNAMLLQIQYPGLMYAASARDWRERFGRVPKRDARPLLILWPFGPVALVYDVDDTEGMPLTDGVNIFAATGDMTQDRIRDFMPLLAKRNIESHWFDAGGGDAGYIEPVSRSTDEHSPNRYRIAINRNHDPAVQFATLTHELGHLFLGHFGGDRHLKIPHRTRPTLSQREIEAESVAFLVCHRNRVRPMSERYLSQYVAEGVGVESLDLYQIMRAAGQVETLLGLTAHTRFDRG